MASFKILSICLRPELLLCQDDLSKAVYILQNCLEAERLTKDDLCNYFGIQRVNLMRRLWSELLGFSACDIGKTKYLSPKYEQELSEFIAEKTRNHSSPSRGKVKTWVFIQLLFSYCLMI